MGDAADDMIDRMGFGGRSERFDGKARYVANQRQTRHHTCHWPGCTKQVPPAMWGCKAHWFALPKPLRDEIWESYRPGQEKDMNPSESYLAAAAGVQQWIKEKLAAQSGAGGKGEA